MRRRFVRLAPVLLIAIVSAAADAATVTRGPYLQLGTPTSIHVRWRTDVALDSRVRYGTDPANLNLVADDALAVTEHEVTVSGLAASTTYYYSVGTLTATLASGPDQRFTTSPVAGKPTRVWVIGDAGTGTASQTQVRDSFLAYTGSRVPDLWLMLGDNAYQSGTDAEYQANVFNVYAKTLEQSVVWPAVGNHDTAQSTSFDPTIPYYQAFTLPANAQAGGVVSGTEAYYSFDYGNIHFVCLDSMTSDRSPTGPMATWLKSDLSQTTKEWVIAYWHHPPYSKGSHDSDTDLQMSQMRQNIVPILESYGVDLVLTGHSHSYERSFLIDGHYGTSTTWDPATMLKQGGSGRDPSPYRKATDGKAPHQGAVYAVAGSSGQTSGGTLNHPIMYVSFSRLGSMVLDVNGSRLDARFLRESATPGVAGSVDDVFSIVKGGPTPPAAPTNLVATALSPNLIGLTWTDNATDETGYSVERSRDAATWSTVGSLGAGATSFTAMGLVKNTTYWFRVRAIGTAGASAYSNVASAKTPKK
jgi:calcineurin-like phosphoesterase family protein/purple acid phosphatase-like protein/fibronectin type III domain protein